MLRIPDRVVYSNTVTATASNFTTFTLPFQDFDGLVAKLTCQTITVVNPGGSTISALNVYIQTTDGVNEGGGPYFYDCVAFGTVNSLITTASALWATIPVNIGDGIYTGLAAGTAVAGYVGGRTGLPLLSSNVRVGWTTANLGSTSSLNFTIQLLANNQSPHA